MKAAIFNKVGDPLEVMDLPDPEPQADEVVLSVGRCGLCGTDIHLTETGGIEAQPGSVLGHEMAGEIVAIGRDVNQLKVGDRVAALPIKGCGKCEPCKKGEPSWCTQGMQMLEGGFAQYARAGAAECVPLLGQLDAVDGALTEPLSVALHGALMAPDLKETIVTVIGSGPIGLASVFWSRRMGARRIQIVGGNSTRQEFALRMGADDVFPRLPPGQPAAEPMAPAPADVVFECVGRPGLLSTAIECTRPRGTVISLGFCMVPENILAMAAAMREVTLKFPIMYTLDDYRQTLDVLNSGAVEPRMMVTDTVTIEQLPDTLESLRNSSHQCKVMVDPWLN